MSGLNKVLLIGNLGKDPDVRYLESGVPVATFPLATTEVYRDRDGNKVERTEWHNVVLWRGLAEVAKNYLRKGAKVYLEGKLSSRSWEDREGHRKYITEIVADNLLILTRNHDSRPGYDNAPNGGNVGIKPSSGSDVADDLVPDSPDDLPF